jgi:hypothetical protein
MRAVCLLLAVCTGTFAEKPSGGERPHRGISFAGGPLSSSATPLGSVAAQTSLAALAATGADHVRLVLTVYQDNATASSVYALAGNSTGQVGTPLATSSLDSLQATARQARDLGLQVFLSPRLDLNWDLMPPGSRTSSGGLVAAVRPAVPQAWFDSYTALLVHYASAICGGAAAAAAGEEGRGAVNPLATAPAACSHFGVADGLEALFAEAEFAPLWTRTVQAVRAALPPATKLVLSSVQPGQVEPELWALVDVLGFNALATPLFQPGYDAEPTGRTVPISSSTRAVSLGWPPVPFGGPLTVNRTAGAGNVTLAQCQRACSVALGPDGACDTVSYAPAAAADGGTGGGGQCFLWSHVAEWAVPGNSTPGWQAFTQQQQQQQQQQANSGGARGSGGGEWPALCRDASAMAAAWGETGAVGAVAAVAARHNKSFLVTAYGGQSRPLAHRSPSGVGQPGQSDCSAANRCYDEVCQAALVEGFHQAWAQAKGYAGSYLWLWSADPTQGGRTHTDTDTHAHTNTHAQT